MMPRCPRHHNFYCDSFKLSTLVTVCSNRYNANKCLESESRQPHPSAKIKVGVKDAGTIFNMHNLSMP